jgi:poly-gamma-glutamate capsule biosynthesis protein CapA/YwtB (metallophosphatase superfamily)
MTHYCRKASLLLLAALLVAPMAVSAAANPVFWNAGPAAYPAAAARGEVIENFESGTVVLTSYPDQDLQPDAWELTEDNCFAGSLALRLYGNTWKMQEIGPQAVSDSTVWRVAVYIETLGQMQAFGVSDGTRELFYTFAGEELPQDSAWWTVYQGAFPRRQWYAYLLPVGADWQATYGDLPTVTHLIYVNDDDAGSPGVTIWDEIADVTDDLPVAPLARILYSAGSMQQVAKGLYRVTAQFLAKVFDPDSDTHQFYWDFGDGATSDLPDPVHQFLVTAHHTYTVGLRVTDPDGLAGGDTCQVRVEVGPAELPLTMNFVGDVFTGRAYESSGGIIDTQGIEALFAPTLPILGEAADLSACNMEVCYTDQGTPHPTKTVVFRSRPENVVGLVYAGFDVLNIANNHIIDYGEAGMVQCLGLLDGLALPYSGAGVNAYFARQPAFLTAKGIRLGFLGFCNRCGRTWNYQPFLDAGYNKPGFAYLLPSNVALALDETRDLADVVIVQLHSGDEYETVPPERGGGLGTPPPVEADAIGPTDPDFSFCVEPSPGDRALRRLVADLGADVVINHHPHVLQGFESYGGKLIAHSLGNFVFDLYYPETMPTLVLTLEITKEGIVGYRFVPAWIDDMIPQPATGQLGREIMDRLADYSRPMNAVLAVDPGRCEARIHLSRSGVDSTVTLSEVPLELAEEGGWWLSPPLALAGTGNLSAVLDVTGDAAGGWEVCWGREILWHGGFEAEGATLWDVNTADEWLDDTVAHGGTRSLVLRRHDSDTGQTGTDLERHLPCDPAKRHTGCGWLKTDNAAGARIMVRFYSSRTGESPLSSTDLAAYVGGTTDWTRQWQDLATPGGAIYFELRCGCEPPAAGTGYAWFDDLALVEWEPWVGADAAVDIPAPNNHRYLQVRRATPATTATIRYAETAYGSTLSAATSEETPSAGRSPLRCFPNPFNPRTTVELTMPQGEGVVSVTVAVYDLRGHRIALLQQGPLPRGARVGLTWDGRDNQGRPAPSGVYLARARIGPQVHAHKLVLVR